MCIRDRSELAGIAKRVVGDNQLVHANTALAIALKQVMSAAVLPDPQYNKGPPGHYKIDELCSWNGKLPDGRTVALEGHCISLTPAGKPRLHPEAIDKDTAASSKVSDWDTLNEGEASVDHDGADPINQSYNRRVMVMGQKITRNGSTPQWFHGSGLTPASACSKERSSNASSRVQNIRSWRFLMAATMGSVAVEMIRP